ncbi:MAG: ATP-binding protein [Pseudomonadota bacterium]
MSHQHATPSPLLLEDEQGLVRLRYHNWVVVAVLVVFVLVFGVAFQHWRLTAIAAITLSLRALLGLWATSTHDARRLPADRVGAIVIVWLGWLGTCMVTGQGQSPLVWTMLVFPVTAAFMMSTASALGISLLSLGGLLFLNASETLVKVPPEFAVGRQEIIALQLISLSVVAAFASGGRRVMDRHALTLHHYRLQAEQARAEAVTADQAKSSFLATMSHEIRTPMNGILGLTELMIRDSLEAEQRRRAELVLMSGEALLRLLNEFLDYAKIEAGHLMLEQQTFSPAGECETALNLVQAAAHRKGLTLRHQLAVPPLLGGDAGRLRQILLNLLNNAVKFTGQGEVELGAETTRHEGDRLWLRFTVRDTGPGIEADALQRIFQPFEQADASTTRHFGGTGLGLTICQHLAAAMGGVITVESRPGQGSCFSLELPFAAVVTLPEPGPELLPSGLTASCQWRARVLLVEDNLVNQVVACGMLRKLGLEVDVVEDGHAAVAAASAQPYDLILMDCHLPRLDGFAATRQIRQAESGGIRRPIVAMTAAAFDEDRAHCAAAGMDDFLPKPLRMGELERVLLRWLTPAARRADEPVPH